MSAKIFPIVLCGGAGSRLWPMSRQLLPKQFLPLVSERTMLQETVERLRGLGGAEPPTVVSNNEHRFLVAEQLRAIGAPPRLQILEPLGRNTAPAVAVAALALERIDPDGVMLVLPADHLIRDVETFHVAVLKAAAAARAGFLVTFGIRPDHPATGYGYIEGGEPIEDHDSVFRVARFVEKPDLGDRAQVRRARHLRLEQRHVRVQRATLSRGAGSPRARDACRLPRGVGEGRDRPRLRPAR